MLGRDGKVVYHSEIGPPGLEELEGKSSDEVTPEHEARVMAYWQQQFGAAGEKWPIEDLPIEEQSAAWERVTRFFYCQQIDTALTTSDSAN